MIFMSNFLALLIKADPSGEEEHGVLAVILVGMNVVLFVSVAVTAWLAAKDEDFSFEVGALETARTVLMADRVASTGDPRRRILRDPEAIEPRSGREESARTVVHLVPERSTG